MSQEFLCQIQRVHLEENSTSTIMKTAQVEKMHSRTTPIDTIAAMKPLRDISDDNFITKTKSYSKTPKNKIDTINLNKIRHFNCPKCCI